MSTEVASPVATAFGNAQKTVASHKKYVLSMQRERSQRPEDFRKEFVTCLNSILVVFKREPAVERLVKFVATFVAVDENGDIDSNFAVGLIEHLLTLGNAKDKAVRLRACQIISAILGQVAENLEISDELWEQTSEMLLYRCKDKVPAVRAAAVFGASFFQDPDEDDDEAITTLVRLLSTDANKDVRKTALQHVAVTKQTLPAILGRLRDNKDELRKFIYQVIAWKVPIKKLNIDQRCQVLTAGLQDRVEAVRQSCATMLCGTWLQVNLESDPIMLLQSLDVEINEKVAALALSEVFSYYKKQKGVAVKAPVSWDQDFAGKLVEAAENPDSAGISCEMALYLRVRCQWCKAQRPVLDCLIDDLLLDLSPMADLIGYHYQQARDGNQSEIYICRQLLECAAMADFSDEAGRRSLVETIRGTLSDINTPEPLMLAALSTLKPALTDEDAFIRLVVEIISELLELVQDMPSPVVSSKESSVERTWLRCLAMASFLLESTQKKLSNGELQGLERSLLLPAVQHREPQIRDRGVMALGQYCLLDKSVAQRYLVLFLQALKNDMLAVQHTAMKVLFDFIFAFDLSPAGAMAEDDAEGEDRAEGGAEDPQQTVMEALLPYVSHAVEDLRTTATEGVSKLMLANRINDPKLLTRMLVLFYNPTTIEDAKLRQCLSVFFEAYSKSNPQNRLCLEACFMPTLRVCAQAPKSSPLRRIKLDELGGYMLHLTDSSLIPTPQRMSQAAEMASAIHERLAVVLLNEVLSEPAAAESRFYCKLLSGLYISTNDAEVIQTLNVLIVSTLDVVTNRYAVSSLKKFQADVATF
eukprot:SAG11_NODE_3047_length_2733_cov_2.293850_1_plen_814_part_10